MKTFIIIKNGTEHATLNAESKEEAVKKVIAYYGEELQVEEEEALQLLILATLSHDNGSTEIKIYATDIESAIQSIMKAEKCPRTAISNIKLVNHGKSL